ncbi:MAG: hypothetical protein QOE39_3204, partial [Bradyrhizobium sp.]|nr:hypothetical protein [Bradyrhizobium sp.]
MMKDERDDAKGFILPSIVHA